MVLIEEDIAGDDANCTNPSVLVFDDFYYSIDFAYLSLIFRDTRFKQFLDTRQALCDVSLRSCDTTSMESTHCQLSARLTNRLRSDNSYRCAKTNQGIRCKITPITFAADATVRQAS